MKIARSFLATVRRRRCEDDCCRRKDLTRWKGEKAGGET